MTTKKPIKRFIAGAVCPKCAELDVLMTYKIDGQEYRECVECGFSDEMRFTSQKRELDTRVNQTEEKLKEETQVVRILKE